MRLLAVLAILLAGCAQTAPPAEDPVAPVASIESGPAWTNMTIAEGDVIWHDTGDAVFDSYSHVAQVTSHPCIYDNGRSMYFTNQVLTQVQLPNGTSEIRVTFDWDDTSYLREALRLGYRPPSEELYRESAPFARGEALAVPVSSEDWADPTVSWGGGIDLWACLDTDTGDGLLPPSLFRGELRYHVEAFA